MRYSNRNSYDNFTQGFKYQIFNWKVCTLSLSNSNLKNTVKQKGDLYSIFLFSRQSSTQCTNTNRDSTWCVLVIFCNYLTQLSELMYSVKLCLLLWQHIRTRKSLSSKSTIIPLPKDLGIREPGSHKRSKKCFLINITCDSDW